MTLKLPTVCQAPAEKAELSAPAIEVAGLQVLQTEGPSRQAPTSPILSRKSESPHRRPNSCGKERPRRGGGFGLRQADCKTVSSSVNP